MKIEKKMFSCNSLRCNDPLVTDYLLEINLTKCENTGDSLNNFKSPCLMKINIEIKLFYCNRLWSNSSLVSDYILEINLTKCENVGYSLNNFQSLFPMKVRIEQKTVRNWFRSFKSTCLSNMNLLVLITWSALVLWKLETKNVSLQFVVV